MQPLHKALLLARNDIVTLFLSIESSLALIPYKDIPATHLALNCAGFESFRNQCIICLRELINGGATINEKDRLGRTLLHWAAFFNIPGLVKELIQKKIKGYEKDYCRMDPIDICIKEDNWETLKIFVKALFILD